MVKINVILLTVGLFAALIQNAASNPIGVGTGCANNLIGKGLAMGSGMPFTGIGPKPGFIGNGYAISNAAAAGAAAANAAAANSAAVINAQCSDVGYGDVSIGGELPVGGSTAVSGNVPVIGYVTFEGTVPAGGIVSVANERICGCN